MSGTASTGDEFACTAGMLRVQSGGSTGAPKQIDRPVHTWLHSAQVEAQVFGIEPRDRFAVLCDRQHSLWAYAEFRAQLSGAPCLGLSAAAIASLDSGLKSQWTSAAPSVVYGVPELVATAARRLQRQLAAAESVRLLLLGGGPLLPGFPMEMVRAAFPFARIWHFYGSAEASFIGFAAPGMPYEPLPTVEVSIREAGDIWVKSPMVITPGHWVNTGDLGAWDSHGTFRVLGRALRQMVIKGKKYAVEPLELALMERFGAARIALVSDARGRVFCFMASQTSSLMGGACFNASSVEPNSSTLGATWIPGLEEVNKALRVLHPGHPGVRRMLALEASEWPFTPAGKTDFSALQGSLRGLDA